MVAYELIIEWEDGTETQRSVSPSKFIKQGSTDLNGDTLDAVEQIYGERPASVFVCLHRSGDGLGDQSDQALQDNCLHFLEFAQAGMIMGSNPNNPNPQVPSRWEYSNPSEIHRP